TVASATEGARPPRISTMLRIRPRSSWLIFLSARARMSISRTLTRRDSRARVKPAKTAGRPARIQGGRKMRVMVLIKADKDSEAGVLPDTKLLTDMGNFNEELSKAGILLAGEGLHPSSKGKRVRFSGSKRTVIDGPFAETKELVAGYWLWKVKSLDEAIDWV